MSDDFAIYFMPKSAGGEPGAGALRAFHVKSIDAESRRITAVASREMIDRDGEIVSLAALKKAMPGYMENPVILSGHAHRLEDGRSPVVGKVVEYHFTKIDLIITVEFSTTDLAEEFWILYRDKFQRAFSIGFRGIQVEDRNIDGKRARVFTEIELYEISVVTVPANAAALSKSFVHRKQIERAAKRILDDPDAYCGLADRYEEAVYSAYKGGVIPDFSEASDFWRQFSDAEKAVLLVHIEREKLLGFDPDALAALDCFCCDFDNDPSGWPGGGRFVDPGRFWRGLCKVISITAYFSMWA